MGEVGSMATFMFGSALGMKALSIWPPKLKVLSL
jgi:hypothetical protein